MALYRGTGTVNQTNWYTLNREVFTATEGQTLFTYTDVTYELGTDTLDVYVNGVKQLLGSAYTETSNTSITFTEGLNAGDKVEMKSFQLKTNTIPLVSNITYSKVSYDVVSNGETTVSTSPYTYSGSGKLLVFVNGVKQEFPDAYTEASSSTIEFTSGLVANDIVEIIIFA